MKKEYHEDTNSIWASFEAGRVCDDFGRPMPFWHCIVVYTTVYTMHKSTVWVYTIQTVGFGEREERVRHETEMTSLREVQHYLQHLMDVEKCYQKVYGE